MRFGVFVHLYQVLANFEYWVPRFQLLLLGVFTFFFEVWMFPVNIVCVYLSIQLVLLSRSGGLTESK